MSSSASKHKSAPEADYTPCGSLAETIKAKLVSLHIHPLHDTSAGRKFSVNIDTGKTTISINIYDIDNTKEGSKTNVTITTQMTYVILCKKGTFFTAGVSDANVTRYLKEHHKLEDITGHPSRLGGARRRHSKRHRRSTKHRRSTRKN